MPNRTNLGGIIHTYQKYDPVNLPSPMQPPPDLASPALEHMLMFGDKPIHRAENLAGPTCLFKATYQDTATAGRIAPRCQNWR